MRTFAENVPQQDAPVVARLRKAGAIIMGKTNLPPLASGNQSDNPLFGRTNNPWNLKYTPGGSSGGSAAAVAAGLSPLDLGSDIGGSIRGPAHLCGIFGLKPTGGRLPLAGHVLAANPTNSLPLWSLMGQFPCYGPLARSIDDLRLAFSIIDDSYSTELEDEKPGLTQNVRLAWTNDSGEMPLSPDIRKALEEVAQKLTEAGFRVERQTSCGFDYNEAWSLTGKCIGAFETMRFPKVKQTLFKLGGPIMSRIMGGGPVVEGFFAGARMSELELMGLVEKREALISGVVQFFSHFDAWLCPVQPISAHPHSEPSSPVYIEGKRFPGVHGPYLLRSV